MFEEYDHVKIIKSGATGIIVDKATINGVTKYIVEGDILNKDAPHGGEYPLYHCLEEDLCEIIEPVAI